MMAYIACMNASKRLFQFANKYLLFAGREVRIGKNCAELTRPQSSSYMRDTAQGETGTEKGSAR